MCVAELLSKPAADSALFRELYAGNCVLCGVKVQEVGTCEHVCGMWAERPLEWRRLGQSGLLSR